MLSLALPGNRAFQTGRPGGGGCGMGRKWGVSAVAVDDEEGMTNWRKREKRGSLRANQPTCNDIQSRGLPLRSLYIQSDYSFGSWGCSSNDCRWIWRIKWIKCVRAVVRPLRKNRTVSLMGNRGVNCAAHSLLGTLQPHSQFSPRNKSKRDLGRAILYALITVYMVDGNKYISTMREHGRGGWVVGTCASRRC